MTFATAWERIETQLQALGLEEYNYRVSLNTMEEATGHGNFDIGYQIRLVDGPIPYREIAVDPTLWESIVEIQLGKQIENYEKEHLAHQTLAIRMEKLVKNIAYEDYPEICMFIWDSKPKTSTRDGSKLVMTGRFRLVYYSEVSIP